jgi:hypothetical protein
MTGFNPQCDELLAQPCLSYQAQYPLPAKLRDAFSELSSQLPTNAGCGLWITPPDALHDLPFAGQVDLHAEIDTLVLVRETIYPSLRNEALASVSLMRRERLPVRTPAG